MISARKRVDFQDRHARSIALLVAVLLAGPVGCAPASRGMLAPPVAGNAASPRRHDALPRGVYYASFRPDVNAVLYYALSATGASLVGREIIDSECSVSTARGFFALDEQLGIDVSAPCGKRVAFLQLPSGVIGRVKPTRTIVSAFPAGAILEGSVDREGRVALAQNALQPTDRDISTVYLYSQNQNGEAKPAQTIHVFTRACSSSITLGPGPLAGSPRSGVAFDSAGGLIAYVGPPPGWRCGYQYLERFDATSGRLTSWLVPGLLPRNAGSGVPFDVMPNVFLTTRAGGLVFGAFTNEPGAFAAHSGGARYGPGASRVQPAPEALFTDARAGLGTHNLQIVPIGVDTRGNVFIQSALGGDTIVEFRREQSGNVVPARTIRLPQDAVAWPGVVVDLRR